MWPFKYRSNKILYENNPVLSMRCPMFALSIGLDIMYVKFVSDLHLNKAGYFTSMHSAEGSSDKFDSTQSIHKKHATGGPMPLVGQIMTSCIYVSWW